VDRAFVGCVLVLEKRILTTGFNGSPAGQSHCDEIGHLLVDGHCVRTIHAETNAIIQAALHGVSTKGATCYVTHLPCINCTKALINAGIARIVYSVAYRTDENAMNFLKAANIEIAQQEFTPVVRAKPHHTRCGFFFTEIRRRGAVAILKPDCISFGGDFIYSLGTMIHSKP
jgi:dCMP deaminase